MTTDTPLTRYSATNGALASGFVTAELHHLMGHDPFLDFQFVQGIGALNFEGGSSTHAADVPPHFPIRNSGEGVNCTSSGTQIRTCVTRVCVLSA
ncbi:MAG: hypothetical protein E5W72_11390 [Mesorhizobium sp.]|uniref:hypothetical protein n=1 Tax=Mesorhizobium sp. TaxID=1871066 RepID=UPI0011F4E2D6|nr:hypothetical protein [Mesorhizobium sp.]TIT04447.1 MAG: hypothetical protein E5W87_00280 [Mesorhizobium sp.]TIT51435.1 MAG: hypothetical protein E5W72_11390 [Mesorhizobium sp.]TKD46952.1 MAG: hypothetical protein E5W98_08560 [Mesorhizobium sp.]